MTVIKFLLFFNEFHYFFVKNCPSFLHFRIKIKSINYNSVSNYLIDVCINQLALSILQKRSSLYKFLIFLQKAALLGLNLFESSWC